VFVRNVREDGSSGGAVTAAAAVAAAGGLGGSKRGVDCRIKGKSGESISGHGFKEELREVGERGKGEIGQDTRQQ